MSDSVVPSIDSFPLRWRWTQPSHAVLPPDVLATICPLPPAEADTLTGRAQAIWALPAGTETRHVDAAEGDDMGVRCWLESLGIDTDAVVVIYWDDGLAVRTIWKTFTAFWGDFCYPASDDVVVMPDHDSWALCYGHEEWLAFWRDAVV
jgi:hypothetical protein